MLLQNIFGYIRAKNYFIGPLPPVTMVLAPPPPCAMLLKRF
jgi:hypothetical protein